jgi:hypothetical protein
MYVVYNAKTREYVSYGGNYTYDIVSYTSRSPLGPFKQQTTMSGIYGGAGD